MSEQNQNNTNIPASQKKKARTRVGVTGVVLIIIALFAVLTGGAIALGWAQLVVKSPSDTVIVTANVCDQALVERFNAAQESSVMTDQQEVTNEALRTISDEVQAKASYEQDPTCQYLVFAAAFANRDAEKAETAATAIAQLATQGVYVNSTVGGLTNTSQLKLRAESLKITDNAMGSG
jgi:hypothetical protein